MSEETNNTNDDTEKTFQSITSELQVEMVKDAALARGSVAILIARLAGEVYHMARAIGLSRKTATRMAMDYWDFEINPHKRVHFVNPGWVIPHGYTEDSDES